MTRVDGTQAVLHDVLPGSQITRDLIRDGKFPELFDMVTKRELGCQSLDAAILDLLRAGALAEHVAYGLAIDKTRVTG